jgi:small subunit ribosomal protein S3Ae
MALQKTVDKWKLKKWFTVYAPKAFKEARVCEIPAFEDKQLINRKIKVSLDTFTHNPQHAFTNVVMKISDVNGDSAHTQLVTIEQLYSYIRSLVRRYRSVASIVSNVNTKDNLKMVVKAMVITRQRVTHSRLKALRSEMGEFINDYSKENSSDEMIEAVIDGKFQSEIASKLSHIAPLNKVEIKKLETTV